MGYAELTKVKNVVPLLTQPTCDRRSGTLVHQKSHYAISGQDGTFKLPDLPAGKYTVTAWQEDYGTQTQDVTISGNESKTVDFTFKAKPY